MESSERKAINSTGLLVDGASSAKATGLITSGPSEAARMRLSSHRSCPLSFLMIAQRTDESSAVVMPANGEVSHFGRTPAEVIDDDGSGLLVPLVTFERLCGGLLPLRHRLLPSTAFHHPSRGEDRR